jgi:2-oxoglutarate dehydrogenase E1 component
MANLLKSFQDSSALYSGNADFIENIYEHYLLEPEQIPIQWRQHFAALAPSATLTAPEAIHSKIRQQLAHTAHLPAPSATSTTVLPGVAAQKQAAVLRLINRYRYLGHQEADLDPLKLTLITPVAELTPEFHKLTEADLNLIFHTGSLYAPDRMQLRDIIALCREVYCGHLGFEYMHITDTAQRRWFQKRVESYRGRPEITALGKQWLLTLLTAAEGVERYLHARYVGQKRFSLEGGEGLIPLLDEIIQRAGRHEVEEIVIGMAHRGRLNVLINILGKPPQEIFKAFEGYAEKKALYLAGDVKYHQGFSCDVDTDGGIIHLALGFNPSHLEIIGPVVEGSVRARQRRRGDLQGNKVIPIIIHGDAAFAGQGVVMETFQLSKTRGFSTGGTIHIVINNQIGFTISHPLDARSTPYCTDVAKMVQAPIVHVNGDDPEALVFAARLCLDYRMTFKSDIVIDLVCYRRHGHNEADEPAVTQPMMYQAIRQHPTARQLYADKLINEQIYTEEQVDNLVTQYRQSIEHGVVNARPILCALPHLYRVNWKNFHNVEWNHPTDTSLPQTQLKTLSLRLLELPMNFKLHSRVQKIWNDRQSMANGMQLVDWGFAEILAYATLLQQGYPVRLSGQDAGRGTFFHRHAVLHNQNTGATWIPLQHISDMQAHFAVIDSILSEEAVLGFEYGYATTQPNSLTLWEAQFGDFANVAQVVIDQFITSGGAKWGLFCGLTMLLPHGYEGQGAEHSSARLERFLQLCAEKNIQVCVPTTPSQIYHLLRRQMLRPYRRPLIVFTPKSLLRHKLATSSITQLATGAFQPVLSEIAPLPAQQIIRIILCTGKVYYDLLEARTAQGLDQVALIRIEQLYPFPSQEFHAVIATFFNADEIIWCQEEPQNQGAWDQIKHRFRNLQEQGKRLYYVGRPAAAAPAVGNFKIHQTEQEQLVDEALHGRIDPVMNRR